MGKEWTVSVLSEYPDEVAVVRSMLSILKGNYTDSWRYVDNASADLLVVGNQGGAAAPVQPVDGQVMARLLPLGEPPAGRGLALERPVRAMPFMDFLNEAAGQLQLRRSTPVPVQAQGPSRSTPLIAACQALAELRKSGTFRRPASLVDEAGAQIAAVNTNRGTVTLPLGLEETVVRLARGFAQALPVTARDWEDAIAASPEQRLDKLSWALGKRLAQQDGLAFWLRPATSFRLMAWPDFGAIGTDRAGMRLSAQLTQRALTPQALSVATGIAQEDVWAFLNATSLCGLLQEHAGPVSRPRPLGARPPEQASVIARLRARLGL